LGEVVQGNDPAAKKQLTRHATTVSRLCDAYMADAEAGRLLTRRGALKKPRTLAGDRGMIEGHIKPLIGGLPVASITADDVENMMHAITQGETASGPRRIGAHGVSQIRGGRGAATRTVGFLGAILSYAVRKKLRTDNPVRGVQRPADGKRDRRLTDAEYGSLGAAFRKAAGQGVWPPAIAAAKFLALTGWRSGEALALLWSEVDIAHRTVILPDTKTGRSMRPLSRAAGDVLSKLGQLTKSELVFPATRGPGTMTGFRKLWDRIAKLGGLPPDVTPHVLRHSFASLAADLGYSEPTIAALVGHKGYTVTSRYIHSADAVLLAAADVVSQRTLELLGDCEWALA
jgi:integrase